MRRIVEWAMLVVLMVRPALDVFTGVSLGGVWKVNPAALTGLVMLALGAMWFAVASLDSRRAVLRSKLLQGFTVWWLLLLVPWVFLPYVSGGPGGAAGVREWLRLASTVPVIVLAISLSGQSKTAWGIRAILFSFALPALFGAYQLVAQSGASIQGFHRIHGTFVHPNPYSFYLICVIAVAYWQWRCAVKPWFWSGFIFAALVLLLATFSLTGFVMFAVWLAVVAWFEGRAARLGVIALGCILVAGVLATDTGRARLAGLAQWDDLDEIERTQRETGSHTWRLLNWRYLYREWKQQPILGYGLASSPMVNPNINVLGGGVGHDPHNDYVRYLVETGAVGLVLWLAFLVWTGRVLWNALRRANAPPQRRGALIALALFAAWAVGGLNDNLITATSYQYILWAIFALFSEPREAE
ncbi:MAG: O-antigen ligase family protein [Candidatus Hinthialibacter antarcticus]|nr:O-antigen ligase family protein [Candidatus Hinthialibacter antarcticus]